MRIHAIAPALALVLLLARAPIASADGVAQAESLPAADAGAVTLDQARSGALALSRTLRKALLGVDSAELTRKTRIYDVLPSPSLNAQTGLSYPSGSSLGDSLAASIGLSVSQTVYDGGKNAALAAIDKIDSAVAQATARAAYFAVVEEVEQAFYSALKANAAEKAALSDLEASRTHLELARAKLEAGIIAKPAFLEAESAAATKETALNQAAAAAKTASRKLASLSGISPGAALSEQDAALFEALSTRIGALTDTGADDLAFVLLTAASKNNPELAEASLAAERAADEVEYAKTDALPTVNASWSHGASYSGSSGLEFSSGSLSLTASIPLDLWTTKAAVKAKGIAALQAELDRGETESSLDLEVRSAVYSAISNARAIASSKKALEYAQGHYESQLESFKLSSLSSSDLSDAEVLLGSARSSLIAARYSFLSGLSALRALAGFEDSSLLEAAIP